MKIETAKILAPLQQSETFEGKIDALINYLKIYTIYCDIAEIIRKPITSPKRKFKVRSVSFRTGTISYIISYMNTVWPYLEVELEKLIIGDEGFYNIRKILLDSKLKCFHEMEKYEQTDVYTFDAIHNISLVSGGKTFPALYENVAFNKEHLIFMKEHCNARSSFLKRLYIYLDSKLISFVNMPEIRASPYEWNSSKKDIEIAEFLYALKLTGRIRILKGNESQFREQFYNFFGLKDKDYNKKQNEIRSRANRSIFLNSLVKALQSA